MKLTLKERKQEAPDVESFIFAPQERLEWKAGQFLHYVLHHEPTDDRGSDRWFTVASAPSEQHVMVTTRFTNEKSSSFKTALQALNVGDNIEISDVDGDFTLEDVDQEYVFIAGGIGVTPFRSILKELDSTGQQLKITLLYANRDQHIPYKTALEEMTTRNPNLRIHHILSPERIDETLIKQQIPNLTTSIFYVSGPEPMVEAMHTLLKGLGVSPERIKGDWFPGYPID